MTHVYLVRHAATAWSGTRLCGRIDLPLSAAGRRQATRLAGRFMDLGLGTARVYSSPARRALETAAPIARALGARVEVDARLREADFGLAEGRTFGELERSWPELARRLLDGDLGIDWPEGERGSDFLARIQDVARELEHLDAADEILVTHGGPLRALAAHLGFGVEVRSALDPAHLIALEHAATWRVAGSWPPVTHSAVLGAQP